MNKAEKCLKELREDKEFKRNVDAIDNDYIVKAMQSYSQHFEKENKELREMNNQLFRLNNQLLDKAEKDKSRIEELKKIIKDVIQTDSNLTDVMRTRLEQILKDNE